MAEEDLIQEVTDQTPSAEGKSTRERSTIEFPYGDLDDAVAVARGVRSIGGSSCDWDQLAAQLNQAANGGGFRQKMLTAKQFGVVTYAQGKVSLTPLGGRICDPLQERAARVEAFLTVPLYKAVYERYRGNTLPPASGLEGEMVTLGVSSKQREKARQYFHRSATQADFFWSGQDRLVTPATGNAAPNTAQEEKPLKPKEDGGGSGGAGHQHPFIEGLIKTLPKAEGPWPLEKRAQWLQAAVSVFNLIYTDDSSDSRIEVKLHKDSNP